MHEGMYKRGKGEHTSQGDQTYLELKAALFAPAQLASIQHGAGVRLPLIVARILTLLLAIGLLSGEAENLQMLSSSISRR